MMRMITALEKHSNIRNLVFVIIASAVTIAAMSYGTKVLVYDIYGEFTMPDTRIAYTMAELEAILSSIDSEGLIIWSQIHLLDYIFPLTYFFALAFGIMLELRTAYPKRGKMKLLLLLPLIGCLTDYLENIFVLSQVLAYPNLSEPIIILASAFTTIKWISLALSFIVIFGLILVILYNRITSRQ
ncbi:MAG: hypothetical protein ACFFCT_13020 [Candidatus Odinarchaeota archaeon]